MIWIIGLIIFTISCIYYIYKYVNEDYSNSERKLYLALFITFGVISILGMYSMFIFSLWTVKEDNIKKYQNDIKYKIELIKQLPVNYDLDSVYTNELNELLRIVRIYNGNLQYIGNNWKYKDNMFYIHWSRNIDETKYPYIDMRSLQEDLKGVL